MKRSHNSDRRDFVRSGLLMAGTASLLPVSRATGAEPRPLIRQGNTFEGKVRTMSNSGAEPSLRADDPNLSSRARELIRIGEIGIARENREALAKFFHPDFRFHGPDGEATREQVWGVFAAYRAAFDNFSVTRQQIFSDGGPHLAARTTFSGIFARPLTGSPVGTIQPNGQSVFYKINNIFRYANDGKLIEEWAQYDSRLFLERLGVRLAPTG